MSPRSSCRKPRHAAVIATVLLLAAVPSLTANALVTVTPATGLVDGQEVSVYSDVSGELADVVVQCSGTLEASECDLDTRVIEVYDSVNSMTVERFIQTDSGLIDCAVVTCSVVYETWNPGRIRPLAGVTVTSRSSSPLDFVATRAVAVRANSSVALGAIDIAASGMAAPDGAAAFTMLCAGVDRQLVCGSAGSVDVDFDGYFSGQVDARVPIVAGDITVDCTTTACFAGVVVLSASGDSIAVRDTIAIRLP